MVILEQRPSPRRGRGGTWERSWQRSRRDLVVGVMVTCDALLEGLTYCPARLHVRARDAREARAEAASEGWMFDPETGRRGEDYCPYHVAQQQSGV